ncbi:MAG: NIPSNAP family protein [Planctomycetes bacterium]|nr:NIPSNAP family protein [Planctomycetota bacterium]
MVTCYLRYRIDMYKLPEFEAYAQLWIPLVQRFGGVHHGYFLPHESDSDLAVALFSFPSLADYENYRSSSMTDPECQAAYAYAEKTRCIVSYKRHFLRPLLPGSDSSQGSST